MEETGGPGEYTDLPEVTDQLYHIMWYSSPSAGIEPTTSVVIGTDCIGSCKSNYNAITTRFRKYDNSTSCRNARFLFYFYK